MAQIAVAARVAGLMSVQTVGTESPMRRNAVWTDEARRRAAIIRILFEGLIVDTVLLLKAAVMGVVEGQALTDTTLNTDARFGNPFKR